MGERGRRQRLARCIYRDRYGCAIVIGGREHRYPTGMTLEELVAERDRLQRLASSRQPATRSGTLGDDVARFLLLVPSGRPRLDRRTELKPWLARFGARHRSTIRRDEIVRQMVEWRDAGFAPSTINHRLTALRALYRELARDETEPNPARLARKLPEDDPQVRAIPIDLAHRIIDLMPDRGRPTKGATRSPISLTKLRLRVMAWTGWPPSTIGRLTREDLAHLEAPTPYVRLTRRRKGRGSQAVWLAVLPEAAAALRALRDAGGLGPFGAGPLSRAWHRACRRYREQQARDGIPEEQRLPHLVPYQIRHGFLTLVAATTRDERAAQAYAQHADIRTTRRYTEASVPERVIQAIAELRARLSGDGVPRAVPRADAETCQKSAKSEQR